MWFLYYKYTRITRNVSTRYSTGTVCEYTVHVIVNTYIIILRYLPAVSVSKFCHDTMIWGGMTAKKANRFSEFLGNLAFWPFFHFFGPFWPFFHFSGYIFL